MKPDISCQKGVTLIELMVAMAIAGVIGTAMFAFQQSQTRSYVTQEALTNMQQNVRAAMHFMTSEIRMAGCDPTNQADAGIDLAKDDAIKFTMDIRSSDQSDVLEYHFYGETDSSGDEIIDYTIRRTDGSISNPGEDITYQLNGDNLVRVDHGSGNSTSILARNIDALDFVYLDADGERIDTGASGELNRNERNRVRAIQITLLARSGSGAPGFVFRHEDTQTYKNRWQENDPTNYPGHLHQANDGFRRLMVSTEVRMRNM